MKKFLAFIFAAAISVQAWAYDGSEVVDGTRWYYNRISDGKGGYNAEITYYSTSSSSYSGALTIPSSIGGYAVTSIGSLAFYKSTGLTSVVIPNSVTSIGSSAFYGCSSLTSITIPDSVTSIGYLAFYNCSSLKSVTIPASVKSISDNPFSNCNALESINVHESNNYYCAIEGVLYSKDKKTLLACPGSKTSFSIPSGVITIGCNAFQGCNILKSVEIPDSVTSIGYDAFKGTPFYDDQPNGLVIFGSVVVGVKGVCPSILCIPYGIKTIESGAFRNCSTLESIVIPPSVQSIGDMAFDCGCSSLSTIYAALGDVDRIKQMVEKSGTDADRMDTSNIHFVETDARYIEEDGCIEVDGIKYCFYLDNYNLVLGTKTGASAVSTDISGVIAIPEILDGHSVKIIAKGAFKDCSSIKELVLPKSIVKIEPGAFEGCNSLASIYYEGDLFHIRQLMADSGIEVDETSFYHKETSWNYIALVNGIEWRFIFTDEGVSLDTECPFSSSNIEDDATFRRVIDKTTKGDIVIPKYMAGRRVVAIGYRAFAFCRDITSVTIPDCVKAINREAFYGCSSLTSVTISEGVTTIGSSAFYGCSSLTSVTIPDSVTTIGASAFEGCSSLTSVTIPEGVTTIGSYAFYSCSSLTSVTILSSVTTIGNRAFYNCSSLMSVTLPIKFSNRNDLSVPPSCAIVSPSKYEESWRYYRDRKMNIEMISQVRESDPTVIDVRYKVNAGYEKVKVRALAFKDGTRSFVNVVRPETFVADVDGNDTAGNIGDEVTANEWHNLSWKVSSDWNIDLAKVKIEILAKNDGEGLAAFETMKVPGVNGHKPMIVAKGAIDDAQALNAMYWLYASKDPAITVASGQARINGTITVNGNTLYSSGTTAKRYIAEKMGYQVLSAADRSYVNNLGRLNLPADIPCKTLEQ